MHVIGTSSKGSTGTCSTINPTVLILNFFKKTVLNFYVLWLPKLMPYIGEQNSSSKNKFFKKKGLVSGEQNIDILPETTVTELLTRRWYCFLLLPTSVSGMLKWGFSAEPTTLRNMLLKSPNLALIGTGASIPISWLTCRVKKKKDKWLVYESSY